MTINDNEIELTLEEAHKQLSEHFKFFDEMIEVLNKEPATLATSNGLIVLNAIRLQTHIFSKEIRISTNRIIKALNKQQL